MNIEKRRELGVMAGKRREERLGSQVVVFYGVFHGKGLLVCAYEKPLDRFTRTIIFIKPALVIVYDRLSAPEPSTFEYWLHAIKEMKADDQHNVVVRNDDVICNVDFMLPQGLTFTQTDQYDPNPRPRIKLREWHLTAKTPDKAKQIEFLTLYRPFRAGQPPTSKAELTNLKGGYALRVTFPDGSLTALLPTDDQAALTHDGLTATGQVKVRLQRAGKTIELTARQLPARY